jgi:hypothetical protein
LAGGLLPAGRRLPRLDPDFEVSGPYLPEAAIDLDPEISLRRARLEGGGVVIHDPVPAVGSERGVVV